MNDDKNRSPNEQDLLLDHNYDGIRELDHPLPNWWLWILYGTIAFSIAYVAYFTLGPGLGQREELKQTMNDLKQELQAGAGAGAPGGSESGAAPAAQPETETTLITAALADANRINLGKGVYTAKCLACHGDKAQGIVGPNLTDDYWIHGDGSIASILDVIRKGVPAKGMPPWDAILRPEEQINLVAFVHSVRGSQPPGAKAPQGELRSTDLRPQDSRPKDSHPKDSRPKESQP